jgi:hypothetical protein
MFQISQNDKVELGHQRPLDLPERRDGRGRAHHGHQRAQHERPALAPAGEGAGERRVGEIERRPHVAGVVEDGARAIDVGEPRVRAHVAPQPEQELVLLRRREARAAEHVGARGERLEDALEMKPDGLRRALGDGAVGVARHVIGDRVRRGDRRGTEDGERRDACEDEEGDELAPDPRSRPRHRHEHWMVPRARNMQ